MIRQTMPNLLNWRGDRAMARTLFAARIGAGITVYGVGLEVYAITAVALGSTLLTGGLGGVAGTAAGVMIVGFLFNLFNLDGSHSTLLRKVVRGLLLTLVFVVRGSPAGARRT
jgi:ribose/xylose/arabinose/galactoside ABC-type transport system permease subunit